MHRVELFLCVQVSSDFGAGQPVARTIAACFGKITGAPLEIGYRSWWYKGIVSPTLLLFKSIIWVELEIRRSSFNLWHWQLWFRHVSFFSCISSWKIGSRTLFSDILSREVYARHHPSLRETWWRLMKNDHADCSLLFFITLSCAQCKRRSWSHVLYGMHSALSFHV